MKTKFLVIVFLITVSISSYAQIVRQDLYAMGKMAYDIDNFKEAALYLFAYKEINMTHMITHEPEKLAKLDAALLHCKENIVNINSSNLNLKPVQYNGSVRFMVDERGMNPSGIENYLSVEGKNYKIKSLLLEESLPVLIEQNPH